MAVPNTTVFLSSIGRAVYSEADLYLFDGPLSAVDPEIEHHLFEECIRDLLEDSAVVLVTHQLAIAQLSDRVMVLNEVSAIHFRYLLLVQAPYVNIPIGMLYRMKLSYMLCIMPKIKQIIKEVLFVSCKDVGYFSCCAGNP